MSTSTDTVSPFPEPAAPPPREVLAPGFVVAGRYEIRAILGSGGYAVVYRAFDRELRGEIALKLLRSDRLGDSARIRFRREARATRQVGSPYLVRIFDIHAEDPLFLTMELVGGGSVRDRIEAGRLPVDEAVRIAIQALEGLKALHALGIIHRDVKPENLLLTREGQVKLADFGLALPWEPDQSRATQAGALIGTLDYMAPEQAMGDPVDGRADLYSLGLVLLEMIAGRPLRDRQGLGLLIERLRGDRPLARDLPAETPAWLVDALGRLLAREPGRRYLSAEAALRALGERRRAWRGNRIRSWKRIRVGVGLILAGIAGVSAMIFLGRREPASAVRLLGAGESGVRAVDSLGRERWSLPDLRPGFSITMARLAPREAPVPVAIVCPTDRPNGEQRRRLSVLDPWTGREKYTVKLPNPAESFEGFADQFGAELRALDLDRDGVDEVLVSYFHSYWPSYTVLYEPRLGRVRSLFIASGHHRVVGYQDVDGDGRAEVLFAGISNRMGWYNAVAAVRLSPWVDVPFRAREESLVASSPDARYGGGPDAALAWYALIPNRRLLRSGAFAIDPRTRTFGLQFEDGSSYRLGFDGFPAAPRSPRPPQAREELRRFAYRSLSEAFRLARLSLGGQATVQARAAITAARQAGDPALEEWARRVEIQMLIHAGDLEKAESTLRDLLTRSAPFADAAFDAARALHVEGRLQRAVHWYREALGQGGPDGAGRSKYELIEGEILALGEMGRWREASRALDAFASAFPGNAQAIDYYRAYLDWRSGRTPDPAEVSSQGAHLDLDRYWLQEFRLSRQRSRIDLEKLLADIRADLPAASTPLDGLLVALEGEVVGRLGREAEGLDLERRAVATLSRVVHEDPIARAHYELVLDRYARLAYRLGQRDLANSLVRERDRFRASRVVGD